MDSSIEDRDLVSEDEDDEFLKPVLNLTKPKPKITEANTAKASLPTEEETLKAMEERARRTAQCTVKYQTTDYRGLDLSDFYWHHYKGHWYPCYHVKCLAGYDQKPRKGQIAVSYMGMLFRLSKKICFVPKKQLAPYNDTSNDADEEEDRDDQATATASATPQWCPLKMKAFQQKILKDKKEGVDDKKHHQQMLEESMYIACVLEMVAAGPPVVSQEEKESPEDEEEEDETVPPVLTQEKPVAAQLFWDPSDEKIIKVIRPGDVIMYTPPVLVATSENMRTSTVKEVFKGSKDKIVLELFDGSYLSGESQVVILKRYLRKKLHENTCPRRILLEKCRLKHGSIDFDPDGEGKESLAQRCSRIMEKNQQETMEWNPNDRDSDDDESEDDESQGQRSKPLKSINETATPRAARPPKVSLGPEMKRAASENTAPPINNTSPKGARPTKRKDPFWKQELEGKLEQCAQERKKRRVDIDGIALKETALRTAMRVREKGHDDQMLDTWATDWDIDPTTLQNYLKGNPNNLLRKEVVRGLNEKFAGVLLDE